MDSVFPPAHLAWPPRLYRPQAPLSRLQPRIHLLFERQDRLGPPFWRTMAPAFRRTITVGNARAFFAKTCSEPDARVIVLTPFSWPTEFLHLYAWRLSACPEPARPSGASV